MDRWIDRHNDIFFKTYHTCHLFWCMNDINIKANVVHRIHSWCKTIIPVLGMSSCWYSVISLLSASVFISKEMSPTNTQQMFTDCKQGQLCPKVWMCLCINWNLFLEQDCIVLPCIANDLHGWQRKLPSWQSITITEPHQLTTEQRLLLNAENTSSETANIPVLGWSSCGHWTLFLKAV